jgi:hypothetical protein
MNDGLQPLYAIMCAFGGVPGDGRSFGGLYCGCVGKCSQREKTHSEGRSQ